jgi:uncharacterized protein DUF4124
MRVIVVSLIFALSAAPSLAETCKYLDKDGRTIYSNVPLKNARKVACFQPPPPVAAETPAPLAPVTQPAPGPDKTRVDAPTQRRRDDERKQILEEELTREQTALAEARRALSDQEAVRYGDERNYERVRERLKPYQEAVEAHEKNIASIKREMANLR